MKISGITVCVNYADLLQVSIDRWHTGLDRMLVVTTPADTATIELCRLHNVETHVTDIFYANEAKFNKGAALSEAIIAKQFRKDAEWVLVFDSDIVPPADWRGIVERCQPKKGILYGCPRYSLPEGTELADCVPLNGARIPQSWVIGFFSLFHLADPLVPADPMFETHWTHAGNFDTSFSWRWPRPERQAMFDMPVTHLGEQRVHWLGRDNKGEGKRHELNQMLGRRQHMNDVDHEKVSPPKMP